ncbi:MAG: thermonuclease family protein [Candidatus Omnitrophica bacterium]|nr:thermonuclease family protein [Candidatus Omnitrophota bacterium]
MPKTLITPAYRRLIQTIHRELHEGTRLAEEDVQQRRVMTYWNVGRHMDHFLLHVDGSERNETPYLRKIAHDLGYSLDVARKILKFYRCYPKLSLKPALSWTQYRALLTAPEGIRKDLEERAGRERLGSEKLYTIISDFRKKMRREELGLGEAKGCCLKHVRGRLFVYKTVQSKTLGLKKNEIMVDCGFKIRHKVIVPSSSRLTGGSLILSVKTEKGYGLKQSLKDDRKLYTYAARLARVIDADTLLLTADVGFDIWLDMTVRLRGIDSPEVTTHAGYKAKQFVVDRLKVPETIVIKSYRAGKFGRYLVDVYYSKKKRSDPRETAREGIFLNQQLLDEGLARLYQG